jgi:hypothetical protein
MKSRLLAAGSRPRPSKSKNVQKFQFLKRYKNLKKQGYIQTSKRASMP